MAQIFSARLFPPEPLLQYPCARRSKFGRALTRSGTSHSCDSTVAGPAERRENVLARCPPSVTPLFRDRKYHDSHRRDRILRFFLHPEIGQFSPHFGAISFLNYTENLEKRKKSTGEKFPPKIQCRQRPEIPDFCPLSWSNAS